MKNNQEEAQHLAVATSVTTKLLKEAFISLYILLDLQKYSINYMDILQASRTLF